MYWKREGHVACDNVLEDRGLPVIMCWMTEGHVACVNVLDDRGPCSLC